MDLYVWSLLLGVVGLGAMAFAGLGVGGGHSSGSHGHHGGDAHVGHGHGHAHAGGDAHAHHTGDSHAGGGRLWALTSPRYLFAFALGFGTAGELLRGVLGGPFLIAGAIAGAVVFERAIVSPLWNLMMRFASTPAVTLESAIADEATAVTAFDQNGQGIVSLEVDGQVVQILATLQAQDRLLPTRVRAGQRLRIDDVNVAKNSCTVSLI